MTTVKIFKNKQIITGFVVSGHSGYAEEGSDIICSAISTLAQSVCVGLENVLNLKPEIKIDVNNAYLSCFINKNVQDEKVQTLFNTFEQTLNLLLLGDKKFKRYIKLEVKNEIY